MRDTEFELRGPHLVICACCVQAYVVAFEVEWSAIVGVDYVNPLCQDGRLVLEARSVCKREFHTVRQRSATFRQHYSSAVCSVTVGHCQVWWPARCAQVTNVWQLHF